MKVQWAIGAGAIMMGMLIGALIILEVGDWIRAWRHRKP